MCLINCVLGLQYSLGVSVNHFWCCVALLQLASGACSHIDLFLQIYCYFCQRYHQDCYLRSFPKPLAVCNSSAWDGCEDAKVAGCYNYRRRLCHCLCLLFLPVLVARVANMSLICAWCLMCYKTGGQPRCGQGTWPFTLALSLNLTHGNGKTNRLTN
jgi:hypothetical protein